MSDNENSAVTIDRGQGAWPPARILVLWNFTDEDPYEHLRDQGPQAVAWDPAVQVAQFHTYAEEWARFLEALRAAGHEVRLANLRNSLDVLTAELRGFAPTVIFNCVESFHDEPQKEIFVAGLYELYGIDYTGSRPDALALCQQKHKAKAVLRDAGVPTAAYRVVTGEGGDLAIARNHGLRFPVIVKPAMEDASTGVDRESICHDQTALDARVTKVLRDFCMPALIEEFIDGREIHCALLGAVPEVGGSAAMMPLPLYEMAFADAVDEHGQPLPKIVTFRAKWDPHSRDYHAVSGLVPAPGLSDAEVAAIEAVAVRAAAALGVRDYARVDMRVCATTGTPFVLEVNPNPDLSEECAFVRCAAAAGLSYEALLPRIAALAIARARAPKPVRARHPGDVLLDEYKARSEAEAASKAG